MNSIPRIVIAATGSGGGKTTLTMGLIGALRKRGLIVQPFKCGPDYIDPGFHTLAAGRSCRNLDTRLIPEETILELFERASAGADIAVIEGVMGLFDGAGPFDERGSTAHLAKLLLAPVIVSMDCRGMARSAGAMALGYDRYDPELQVAGYIGNNLGSRRHYDLIAPAIESATRGIAFGYLPRNPDLTMPERHLGLVPAWETGGLRGSDGSGRDAGDTVSRFLRDAAAAVEETVDVDGILRAARSADPIRGCRGSGGLFATLKKGRTVRIGYAGDDAFCFYYRDNLDILEALGAELIRFSPVADDVLPEDLGALYFGGGYPELFACRLQENQTMRKAVTAAIHAGMPAIAECGGLMYLCRTLIDAEGNEYEMCGAVPGRVTMKRRLGALGYYDAEILNPCFFGASGERAVGHVFRWSTLETEENGAARAFLLRKPDSSGRVVEPLADGFVVNACVASYLHLHFASCPEWADRFVDAAREYRAL